MNKSKIAIINGLLFINNKFVKGNIIIEGDKIKNVIPGKLQDFDLSNHYVIEANGSYVSYGFFDPHVHFRTPGTEYKEDWESGANAAIKGGYTFVVDMPNNNPPAVDLQTLELKNELASKSPINYGFYIGLTTENYKNIKHIFKQCKIRNIPVYGVKVFLGSSTGNLLVKAAEAIKYSLNTSLINLFHCEDEETLELLDKGKYSSLEEHEATRPYTAEVNGIKKIIKIARTIKNRANIYICHVSSEQGVKLINKYRKKGFNILSEITPHHLFFSLEEIENSPIYKVNPPIRHLDDVLSLRKSFNKGYFQIIGTDHAPHLYKEKISDNPPSGIPGIESSFYALYSLYQNRQLSLKKIFTYLTSGYQLFNIKKRGLLKKGYYADITIINRESNIFKVENSASKADFSPYDKLETNAFIDTVIIGGKIYLKNGELIKWR